jgi:hypothetical protein
MGNDRTLAPNDANTLLVRASKWPQGCYVMADKAPTSPAAATPEQAILQFAMANPGVPKIYGSSFQAFVNPLDVSVVFSVNGTPTGLVNLSYPLAKALGISMMELVQKYESLTKTTVVSAIETEITFKAAVGQP